MSRISKLRERTRTKIRNLNDDTVARVRQSIAGGVGFDGQSVECAAGRAGACSRTCTVKVLRNGGRVTWRSIEATRSSSDIAVSRAVLITAAVLGEGSRVCLGLDTESQRRNK